MATQSNTVKRSEEVYTHSRVKNENTGKLGNKSFVVADHQTSKGWYILAIVVGAIIVVGIGGFGAAGLLHTYGVISLPQWLASAVGTVGHTAHSWSLWAMGVGGSVVGIGFIIYGSYKLIVKPQTIEEKSHKELQRERDFKQVQKKNEDEIKKVNVNKLKTAELEDVLSKRLENRFNQANFNFLQISAKQFEKMKSNTYMIVEIQKDMERPDRFYMVRKTPQNTLECTFRIDEVLRDELAGKLRNEHYQVVEKKWYENITQTIPVVVQNKWQQLFQ